MHSLPMPLPKEIGKRTIPYRPKQSEKWCRTISEYIPLVGEYIYLCHFDIYSCQVNIYIYIFRYSFKHSVILLYFKTLLSDDIVWVYLEEQRVDCIPGIPLASRYEAPHFKYKYENTDTQLQASHPKQMQKYKHPTFIECNSLHFLYIWNAKQIYEM